MSKCQINTYIYANKMGAFYLMSNSVNLNISAYIMLRYFVLNYRLYSISFKKSHRVL